MWRLDLDHYFFTDVHVVATPRIDEDEVDLNKMDPDINVQHSHDPDDGVIYIMMKLTNNSESDDENEGQYPYHFELQVMGFFIPQSTADEEEDEEDISEQYRRLVINGAQILYGVCRDYLHTITGKGPYRALTLPTKYFTLKNVEYNSMNNSKTE